MSDMSTDDFADAIKGLAKAFDFPAGSIPLAAEALLCPVGCDRPRRDGHLMCYECWLLVPRNVRARVQRTWRDLQFGQPGAAESYRQARESAIWWAGR